MKKNNIPLLIHGVIISTVFLIASCSLNPELVEMKSPVPLAIVDPTVSALRGHVISYPIVMDRVQLFMDKESNVTGTVTVQITNNDGTVVLGSRTVQASSIVTDISGTGAWNTFYFPNLTLYSGIKYRINVMRSNPNDAPNDRISWKSSNGASDVYPKGSSSPVGNVSIDMSFVTYSDGIADQQQMLHPYGITISDTFSRWQEFVPEKIMVVGP